MVKSIGPTSPEFRSSGPVPESKGKSGKKIDKKAMKAAKQNLQQKGRRVEIKFEGDKEISRGKGAYRAHGIGSRLLGKKGAIGDIYRALESFSTEPDKAKGTLTKLVSSFGKYLKSTKRGVLCDAIALGKKEAVEFLLAKVDVNEKAPDGWSALHEACRTGDREIVQLLLKNRASVGVFSKGQLPIDVALEQGNYGVASPTSLLVVS